MNISFAIRHLEEIEGFFQNEKVLRDLHGFVENKDHKYLARDRNEAMAIILTYEVYAVSFPKKIRKASSYLYLVSADRLQDAQMVDTCHYYAMALDVIADGLEEIMDGVLADKAVLIAGENPAICKLVCTRIQAAFFKFDRTVACLWQLKRFS